MSQGLFPAFLCSMRSTGQQLHTEQKVIHGEDSTLPTRAPQGRTRPPSSQSKHEIVTVGLIDRFLQWILSYIKRRQSKNILFLTQILSFSYLFWWKRKNTQAFKIMNKPKLIYIWIGNIKVNTQTWNACTSVQKHVDTHTLDINTTFVTILNVTWIRSYYWKPMSRQL